MPDEILEGWRFLGKRVATGGLAAARLGHRFRLGLGRLRAWLRRASSGDGFLAQLAFGR